MPTRGRAVGRRFRVSVFRLCDEWWADGVNSSAAVALKISPLRFSRDAKNEMRLYRISPDDVAKTVDYPVGRDVDERGNAASLGTGGLSLS